MWNYWRRWLGFVPWCQDWLLVLDTLMPTAIVAFSGALANKSNKGLGYLGHVNWCLDWLLVDMVFKIADVNKL